MGAVSSPRYTVRYDGYRVMDREHAAYWTHGGYVLRVAADHTLAANLPLEVDVVAPDGTAFRFACRSGQAPPDGGFMVSFEDSSATEKERFDAYVSSTEFRQALELESETEASEPRIIVGDAADVDPDDDSDESPPEPPPPGQTYPIYAVSFDRLTDFLERQGETGLSIPFREPTYERGAVALLRLTLPGRGQFECWSRLESVGPDALALSLSPDDPAWTKALAYTGSEAGRARRESESMEDCTEPRVVRLEGKMPDSEADRMPLRRRLQRMGMEDKINLALSGNREERMALATDGNKAIHHYVLRNAKITIEEIAIMSRLPSLNPDVLNRIAENPQYTQNPAIAKALALNPRTPVRTAVRMLDRVPRADVMMIARRGTLNRRLVEAAKKKVGID